MDTVKARRPAVVGVIGIVMYVEAVILLLLGIAAVSVRNSEEVLGSPDISSTEALTLGLVAIGAGLLLLVVGRGLRRGDRTARALVVVAQLASIGASFYYAISGGDAESIGSTVVSVLISIAIIWVLYRGEESRRYFGDA